MNKTFIRYSNKCVGDLFESENLLNEYKEFTILTDNDSKEKLYENEKHIKQLIRGKVPLQISNRIFRSIHMYLDKYFIKYFISLSNLNNKENKENFSKLYIGINDNPSIITGIPIQKSQLPALVKSINNKLLRFMTQIYAFHSKKESRKYIISGGQKYYNFDKLLAILFRLFTVNIHVLNKTKRKDICVKVKINDIYKSNRNYKKMINQLRRHNKIIYSLNNKYSQSLSIIVLNYEIMNRMEKFIKKNYPLYPFKAIHSILKIYMKNKYNIPNYIDNGIYRENSIHSDVFSEYQIKKYINIFLEQFREFRTLQNSKMKVKRIINPYSKKYNPLERISTTVLQINNFNNVLTCNDDIIQILIEIKIPIIKDKHAILGYCDHGIWKFPRRKMVKMGEILSPSTYLG